MLDRRVTREPPFSSLLTKNLEKDPFFLSQGCFLTTSTGESRLWLHLTRLQPCETAHRLRRDTRH